MKPYKQMSVHDLDTYRSNVRNWAYKYENDGNKEMANLLMKHKLDVTKELHKLEEDLALVKFEAYYDNDDLPTHTD